MEQKNNNTESGFDPNKRPIPKHNNANNNDGMAKKLKAIAGVLGLGLLIAIGALFYVISNSNKITDEKVQIALEKQQITTALEDLRGEYGMLVSNNDSLNVELNSERQKIDILLDKIKKTDATSRQKIMEYDREITRLRGMLSNFVRQVDSLSSVNRELTAENIQIRQEADLSKQKVEQLSQEAGNLKSIVERGSNIKARGITVVGLNRRDKEAPRAKQVEQIRVCFTLIENSIAEKGNKNVYIRIKAPEGSLLTRSITNLFEPTGGGSQLIYSEMRTIDYQGDDLELCIFYKDQDFMTGNYSIEVYLEGDLMGTSQLSLK